MDYNLYFAALRALPPPVWVAIVICLLTIGYALKIVFSKAHDCPKIFAVMMLAGSLMFLVLLAAKVTAVVCLADKVGAEQLYGGYSQLQQLYDVFDLAIDLLVLKVLYNAHPKQGDNPHGQ